MIPWLWLQRHHEVDISGFERDVWTNIGQIAMKFGTDIHVPRKTYFTSSPSSFEKCHFPNILIYDQLPEKPSLPSSISTNTGLLCVWCSNMC